MAVSEPILRQRTVFALTGALAGISFWGLFEWLPDLVSNVHVLLFITALVAGFFGSLLLMMGRLELPRALLFAGAIALAAAVLLIWSSFRFSDFSDFADNFFAFLAFGLLIWLPIPFVLAHETATKGWRDYDVLFDQAWSIFVRAVVAWGFVGVFWLVLLLSDALLSLVGFKYLGDFIEEPWIAMPLSGLVLGLALAVLVELANVVSVLRRLALVLLRLLLPVVTVVTALFILLVPFRGLDDVFGSLSAAATMLGMGLAAITLVTTSIDGTDEHAATSRLMVISARIMALLLPVIVGIALYAIWLRVVQYGWTPPRLAGALIALVAFLYAASYGVSVVSPTNWRKHIRTSNTLMALLIIAVSGLWLSPVLNAERISATSQVSRFIDGRVTVAQLDVWKLGNEWGKAGLAALQRLRMLTDHAESAALAAKIAAFDRGDSQYDYRDRNQSEDRQSTLDSLAEVLPVLPDTLGSANMVLAGMRTELLVQILGSCNTPLPDGRAGCALVFGEFDTRAQKPSAIVFMRDDASDRTVISISTWQSDLQEYRSTFRLQPRGTDMRDAPATDIIRKILDGEFEFVPTGLQALRIDGMEILPYP